MGKIPINSTIAESYIPESINNKTLYVVMTAAKKVGVMPDFIKDLRKKGANVYIFWSENAYEKFKNDKDRSLASLRAERVGDDNRERSIPEEDMVIVMPCTFNTLSKIANGIADNYATSLVQSAISRKKTVVVVPSYNEYWYHPLNLGYIERLQSWGVIVVFPDIKPHKITMITPLKVLDIVIKHFMKTKFTSHRLSTPELEGLRKTAVGKFYKHFRHIGKQQEIDKTNSSAHGCYSALVNDDWILISAAGCQLSKLTPDDLTLLHKSYDKKDGIYWVGKKPPSSESPLHIKIYEVSDSRAVVHSHSPSITYSSKYEQYHTSDYVPYGEYDNLDSVQEIIKTGQKFFILKYHGEVALAKNLVQAHKVIDSLKTASS